MNKTQTSIREQAENLLRWYPTEIARIKSDILNSEDWVQRTINVGFARMGVARFTRSGDDLWEMIVAIENGWEYQRPPRHLVDRWASA